MGARPRSCYDDEPQGVVTGSTSSADDDLADQISDVAAALARLDAELAGADARAVAGVAPMLARIREAVRRLPRGRKPRRVGFGG